MTGPERRRAPRVVTRLPLTIRDKQEELIARTKNISASGAYCTLRRALAPMTKLQVRLEIPGRRHPTRISCEGVVVRVDRPSGNPYRGSCNVAIFFSDIADRHRAVLAHYVHQRLNASSPRG